MSISEKLTYLNTTKGKIKDSINLTGAGITTEPFRQYAVKLKDAYVDIINNGTETLYNNFPKVSATGESLNLQDTYEAPMNIDLKGNTLQNGTPTPSSPIPVNNVSGDNDIVVCGKNLFNASIQSGTYGGATYSVASDGLITQSASDSSAWNISQERIFYLPAGTYTISIDVKSGAKQYMQLHDIVNDTDVAITSSNSRTFTLTQTTALGFKTYGSGGTYPVSYYLQIEQSNQATTYEAYNGTTYNINLGSIELCKIGTYQDYIYKENDKWYLHKEIVKVVVDGSDADNWNYSNTCLQSKNEYPVGIITPNADRLGLSNYFICKYYATQITNNLVNGEFGWNSGSCLTFKLDNMADKQSYLDWFSLHNTNVYGILATPTNTEITDTTLIEQLEAIYNAKSKNGTTNINQENNDLPFIITASALEKES